MWRRDIPHIWHENIQKWECLKCRMISGDPCLCACHYEEEPMSPITARFEAGEPTDGLHGKHGKPLINWARDIASGRAAEQPPPDQAQQRERSIQGMVISDLVTRMEVGKQRYGTYLHAGNGRDALRDAYEEALDLACYLKQAIEERDWAQRNDGAVIEDPK